MKGVKERECRGGKTVILPSGESVPAFGMGTWRMGEDVRVRKEELATLKLGLDLGVTLIDTAEMYGEGRTEELVGQAIAGRRDEVFLVDKVLPSNASREGTLAACDRSLSRLKTDRIDLYLLHWKGSVPLSETVEAFTDLQQADKIRHYGVSNLDVDEMKELWSVPRGQGVQSNQLLYNLSRRGIEWDLLPWLRERGIPVMAYSPVEQARLTEDARLIHLARSNGMSAAQMALAWLLAKKDIIVIPKTSHRKRLRENVAALDYYLTASQLSELDRLFPPPAGPQPLEML
ncbi:MAG TPA: aldo/keto reductase [Clostridia bacterium]|nr:aldo/keto reductase [Clostridia bacterium]